MNSLSQPKKILVAPLGWGLGHATRCIPIIRELQRQGATVAFASDGEALALLRQVFPDLTSFEMPSYKVKYRTRFMVWNMAWHSPRILRTIWLEHRTAQQLVARHGFDGIISDNRFGCFSSIKHCIFLTHQVNIQIPFFLLKKIVNLFNFLIINQFNECWIPDLCASPNLSGELSHPVNPFLKKKTSYIGALTQLPVGQTSSKRFDAIAVLSGPEPQRTRLEAALIQQFGQLSGTFLIIQGKPEQLHEAPTFIPNNVKMIPYLTGEALHNALLESEVFIGRSGYSTVMDLARLGKCALLIPTPGQTEQEYLAAKFLEENVFFTQKQNKLHLKSGLAEAVKRSGLHNHFFDEEALKNAITTFLVKC
ncbi:MAG: glycosyltransferase [Bacteroidetes bacterium]|nr:glycosyltransferase [Bacteroidota bacterium]